MSAGLLRERSRIVTRWDEEEDALDEALKGEPSLPVFFSDDGITSAGRCGRARHAAGQRLSVMVAWLSTAAATYWMAALVPGLAVFALTVEIDDRPGGGPYTTKALLSIARAAAMPVGFAAALYGPLRRIATQSWRRPVALALLPLVYGAVPNAAFALGAVGGVGGLALQLVGRFLGSAVISLAFCAYLACAQGRRASDVAMPVATLAILLAPAVSRPLSMYVADWLGSIDDTSDNDGHLWMPLAVSVLCAAPTLAAAAALTVMPPPNQADVRARSAHVGAHERDDSMGAQGVLLYRAPGGAVDVAAMSTGADRAWFRRHWSLVAGLAVSNAALQGLGAVRDVFTADLVGADAPWWHSVVADAPACVAACLCYVPLIWLKDNRRAFIVIGGVGLVAAVVVLSTGAASAAGWLSPLAFLVTGGVGHFFALVPFSGGGIVFERLMGASHMAVDPLLVNVVCQVPAYVAALGVLLLAPAAAHPAAFFEWTAVLCGGVLVASCVWTVVAAVCLLPLAAPALEDDVAPLLSSFESVRGQGDDDDDDDDALYEARDDEDDVTIRCADRAGAAAVPFFRGCTDVVVL